MAVAQRDGVGRKTGTATTVQFEKPYDVKEFDLILAFACRDDGGAASGVTLPSGWRRVAHFDSTLSNGQYVAAYAKVATASEPSVYYFPLTGSTVAWSTVTIALFHPHGRALEIYEVKQGEEPSGDSTHTSSVVTNVLEDELIVSAFGQDNASGDGSWAASSPAGLSLKGQQWSGSTTNVGLGVFVEHRDEAGTADDHVVTQTSGGTNTLASAWVAFAVRGAGTYAATILAHAPDSYYRFADPDPLADLGYLGADLTGDSTPTRVPGIVESDGTAIENNAYTYSGTNQRFVAAEGISEHQFLHGTPFSVTVTVAHPNPTAAGAAFERILECRDAGGDSRGWLFYLQGAGSVSFDVDNGPAIDGVGAATAMTPNQPALLHVTYDPDTAELTIYKDGEAVGGDTLSPAPNITAHPQGLAIGSTSDVANNDFSGTIDDVALWRRKLSASEIRQQWAAWQAGNLAHPRSSNLDIGMDNLFSYASTVTREVDPDPQGHYAAKLLLNAADDSDYGTYYFYEQRPMQGREYRFGCDLRAGPTTKGKLCVVTLGARGGASGQNGISPDMTLDHVWQDITTYDQWSNIVVTDADHTDLNGFILINGDSASGDYFWARNFRLQLNRCLNPVQVANANSWGPFLSSCSVARSTAQTPPNFSASLALTASGANAYIGVNHTSTDLNLVQGELYEARWWVYAPTAGSYNALVQDADGETWSADVPVTLVSNTWKEIVVPYRAGNWEMEADEFTFRLNKTSGTFSGETVYFGHLQLYGPFKGHQQSRPDADIVATGWTSTPLTDRISSDAPGDGVFITATAS